MNMNESMEQLKVAGEQKNLEKMRNKSKRDLIKLKSHFGYSTDNMYQGDRQDSELNIINTGPREILTSQKIAGRILCLFDTG